MARYFVVYAAAFLALVALASLPSAGAAAPAYYEGVIVDDGPADYAQRDWADILAVYISEQFSFDPDKKILKGDHLVFRIELAAGSGWPCTSPATLTRYDVQFNVDGAAKNVSSVVGTLSPSDQGNACGPMSSGGSATTQFLGDSLILVLPSSAYGVVSGSVISDVWAFSSTTVAGQTFVHDVAPQDNANSPSGSAAKPGGELLSYNAVGVFPFLTVEPTTPLEQYSVNGAEVQYKFLFYSHPDLKDDNIRVRFQIPEGWTLSPSRGSTGVDPEGQMSGGSNGEPVEFAFTASATGIVNEGDVATIVMDVITDAGGHVEVVTQTTVSGPKVSDPNFTLDLTSKGPFKAEDETAIRFTAAHPTINLSSEKLAIDVFLGNRKITTLPATLVGPGLYEVIYAFPGDGEFRLDVFVSSLKPSPHQEFTVSVEKGGLAPGPGLALVAAALVGLVGYLRRNR